MACSAISWLTWPRISRWRGFLHHHWLRKHNLDLFLCIHSLLSDFLNIHIQKKYKFSLIWKNCLDSSNSSCSPLFSVPTAWMGVMSQSSQDYAFPCCLSTFSITYLLPFILSLLCFSARIVSFFSVDLFCLIFLKKIVILPHDCIALLRGYINSQEIFSVLIFVFNFLRRVLFHHW